MFVAGIGQSSSIEKMFCIENIGQASSRKHHVRVGPPKRQILLRSIWMLVISLLLISFCPCLVDFGQDNESIFFYRGSFCRDTHVQCLKWTKSFSGDERMHPAHWFRLSFNARASSLSLLFPFAKFTFLFPFMKSYMLRERGKDLVSTTTTTP